MVFSVAVQLASKSLIAATSAVALPTAFDSLDGSKTGYALPRIRTVGLPARSGALMRPPCYFDGGNSLKAGSPEQAAPRTGLLQDAAGYSR
jgi:hypothetical protein